jgi:hypothetical protein
VHAEDDRDRATLALPVLDADAHTVTRAALPEMPQYVVSEQPAMYATTQTAPSGPD